MKNSTTITSKKNKNVIRIWVIAAWLLIWQVAAVLVGHDFLFASPISVIKTLFSLLLTKELYSSVLFSLSRITLGFFLAMVFGSFLGAFSYRYRYVREFLSLPVSLIKATPVASFIILVLIWIPSRNLSIFISFLIAFPVFYTNTMVGIESVDTKLLEMAEVFSISFLKRLRAIYIPQVIPTFRGAAELSVGMCWKAGVAAEIIGLARGSIGEKLYEAKIYLETPSLFAWSLVIVTVSVAFTKLVMYLINRLADRLEGR